VQQRVITQYTNSPLWQEEHEGCLNAVSQSPHTRIVVMPNHSLNQDGEMAGYVFSAHPQDSAAVLPVGKRMCAGMSMYECTSHAAGRRPFNDQVLHVVNNLERYRAALHEYVRVLRAAESPPASFDCIRSQAQDRGIRRAIPWVKASTASSWLPCGKAAASSTSSAAHLALRGR
jgi:hypothetical protein